MKKTTKPFEWLNLQMFADDGTGESGNGSQNNDGGQTPPKQKYSDEEYIKLKQAFDNSASEIANLKKQIKAKQTDEEQKAQAQAEKEAEIENMRKELTSIKTKAQLMKVFDEKDADTLTQCIVDNDTTKLLENFMQIGESIQLNLSKFNPKLAKTLTDFVKGKIHVDKANLQITKKSDNNKVTAKNNINLSAEQITKDADLIYSDMLIDSIK